jgi:hypothetical protein
MKIKETDLFVVEEFFHPTIFRYLERSGVERWRWFLQGSKLGRLPFVMEFAILLRNLTGEPLTVNNWHTGGQHVGRCFRPPDYRPANGALYSQHYLGKAIDVSSAKYSPKQLFDIINSNEQDFRNIGLTTIENVSATPTWLHADCRTIIPDAYPKAGFLIVNP